LQFRIELAKVEWLPGATGMRGRTIQARPTTVLGAALAEHTTWQELLIISMAGRTPDWTSYALA